MSDPLSVQERLHLYCTAQKRAIQVPALGEGTDGGVFRTDMKTAVKVFHRQCTYETERDCYRVLQEHNITDICGFTVPWMREFSDSLMVIEMSIVEPPCVLDFGKAYLHENPPYDDEQMAEWLETQKRVWKSHWPTIRKILSQLQSLGIFQPDPSPRNIIANWDPPLSIDDDD